VVRDRQLRYPTCRAARCRSSSGSDAQHRNDMHGGDLPARYSQFTHDCLTKPRCTKMGHFPSTCRGHHHSRAWTRHSRHIPSPGMNGRFRGPARTVRTQRIAPGPDSPDPAATCTPTPRRRAEGDRPAERAGGGNVSDDRGTSSGVGAASNRSSQTTYSYVLRPLERTAASTAWPTLA